MAESSSADLSAGENNKKRREESVDLRHSAAQRRHSNFLYWIVLVYCNICSTVMDTRPLPTGCPMKVDQWHEFAY
jgi:hypothetical protein